MAKEFFKRLAVPIIIALLTAFFCQPLYLATDGSCDYVLMWILIGIPFGIQKMFIWLVPSKCSIANATGIIVINILIGGMIGIFVFAFRIASGMLYMIAAMYMVNNSSSRKRYASPKAGTELYLDLVFRQ